MAGADQEQERAWTALYHGLVELFRAYGVQNAFGEGDFWVVSDNYGWRRQTVYLFNLDLLREPIVQAVQSLLVAFPEWEIVLVVDVVGKEEEWPPMGITIRESEIIDGLRREYLPPRFRNFELPGSRRGTGYD